jgi:predicted regulator of Ras-like GTPase activity (Roadblock/LC7/MglB family)
VSTPYRPALEQLARRRGVAGCMVVDAHDDIVVDAAVRDAVQTSTVAAIGASLYRRARHAARAAGLGEVGLLRLEGERGHVFAVGRGDLVLVAVADSGVNIGLVRTEMLKAVEVLA